VYSILMNLNEQKMMTVDLLLLNQLQIKIDPISEYAEVLQGKLPLSLMLH
jgi:hypothetical protein